MQEGGHLYQLVCGTGRGSLASCMSRNYSHSWNPKLGSQVHAQKGSGDLPPEPCARVSNSWEGPGGRQALSGVCGFCLPKSGKRGSCEG